MNDLDDVPLKNMIVEALESCHDNDLLDLIYKLLIFETPEPQRQTRRAE